MHSNVMLTFSGSHVIGPEKKNIFLFFPAAEACELTGAVH